MLQVLEGRVYTALLQEAGDVAETYLCPVSTSGLILDDAYRAAVRQRCVDVLPQIRRAWARGEMTIGNCVVVKRTGGKYPHMLLLLPIHRHWRSRARLDYIVEGLQALPRVLREAQVTWLDMPGQIDEGAEGLWETVAPRVRLLAASLPHIRMRVFIDPPKGVT